MSMARTLAETAGRRPRSAPSARVRILGWYVVLLGLAMIGALVVQSALLRSQLDDEVDRSLTQEVDELRQLAVGRDPETGQPFGDDAASIFDTFLRRNIPHQGEAIFTLVDGEPYHSSVTPLQLLEDPDLVATWAGLTDSAGDEIETTAGPVRWLAVPLSSDGQALGTFVVANFLAEGRAEVDAAIRVAAIVLGSTFVIASLAAWIAAGRVLRPVRLLTEAAREIDDRTWSERIPVEGDDEVAELARTFNEMLDRLEEAFSTQRRFIDDAGHELRTPITIIRGHLELMGDDADERRETMALVMDELDRMTRIVDDLLVLAKAEQPGFIDRHPIDVAELTEEIAAKASALGDRGWQVESVARVVIEADRQRLTQAAMNLARNAAEHTAAGTPVYLGSRDDADEVRIWVRDEGPGITDVDRARIFERFARGASGRRRTEGAGLGLAIVRAIAEAHGGRVELDSSPGIGSTFSIVVPIVPDRPDAEIATEAAVVVEPAVVS
jgi:signal transduction histidine kinase